VLIIDGHLDMAYNALFHRRDLTLPVYTIREREDEVHNASPGHPDALPERSGPEIESPGTCTVTLPEMRRGEVGIMVSTIMARVQAQGSNLHNAARTRLQARARAMGHLAYYQALERAGEIEFIKDTATLERMAGAWQVPSTETPVGLILSAESADPILSPDQVEFWHEAGLRSISLTHFGANTYGHGTGTEGGLYPPAYPLMDALAQTDIAIDLTHAADIAFWQIMDYWKGPVHASHCNCRALLRGQRHLSDDMIRAIVERDGVIGVVFAESMLNPAWDFEDLSSRRHNARRPMRAVLAHVRHICELAGNCNHVAFGTDLDGGFGRELSPTDYDTIADLQRFLGLMMEDGFTREETEAFANGNLRLFFGRIWGD
jgi:membrane dipeptidase